MLHQPNDFFGGKAKQKWADNKKWLLTTLSAFSGKKLAVPTIARGRHNTTQSTSAKANEQNITQNIEENLCVSI